MRTFDGRAGLRVFCRCVLATWLLAGAAGAQDFSLALVPCPADARGAPGGPWRAEFDVVLTTSNSPKDVGAQGWAISVATTGIEMADITTRGTVAAAIDDEPPGLRDQGFEKTEVTTQGYGEMIGDLAWGSQVASGVGFAWRPPGGWVRDWVSQGGCRPVGRPWQGEGSASGAGAKWT